ncbi:8545_t:CDS:2, partial [Racocetra fulgida]
KEEDVSKNKNKVSDKDSKSDIPTNNKKKCCEDKGKEDVKVSLTNNDKENISRLCSNGYCGGKKNKIERDENKTLICYQDTSNIDKDEKQILEQNSEHIEGGESFVEPKSEDQDRLIFDQGKLSKSKDPLSDIHCDEVDAKCIPVEPNSEKHEASFDEARVFKWDTKVVDDVKFCRQADVGYRKDSRGSNANNAKSKTYDDVVKKGDGNLRDKIE